MLLIYRRALARCYKSCSASWRMWLVRKHSCCLRKQYSTSGLHNLCTLRHVSHPQCCSITSSFIVSYTDMLEGPAQYGQCLERPWKQRQRAKHGGGSHGEVMPCHFGTMQRLWHLTNICKCLKSMLCHIPFIHPASSSVFVSLGNAYIYTQS